MRICRLTGVLDAIAESFLRYFVLRSSCLRGSGRGVATGFCRIAVGVMISCECFCDAEIMASLDLPCPNSSIVCFLSTWCADCKTERAATVLSAGTDRLDSQWKTRVQRFNRRWICCSWAVMMAVHGLHLCDRESGKSCFDKTLSHSKKRNNYSKPASFMLVSIVLATSAMVLGSKWLSIATLVFFSFTAMKRRI